MGDEPSTPFSHIPEHAAMAEAAGAFYLGTQCHQLWVRNPFTGNVLVIPQEEAAVPRLEELLQIDQKRFTGA